MKFHYRKKFDVAVVGGGVAGIAAAVAAARSGKSVALIEKQTLIGGLATSGLIFVFLPICDGHGTQVTFGLAEELLKASLNYGPFDLSEKWGGKPGKGLSRYACQFSPAGFVLTLDRKLKEAGVELWLDTMVCAANTASDGRVTSVEVENVSGRGRIEAKCFVDATGSAAVLRGAGGEIHSVGTNFNTPWVIEYCSGAKDHYLIRDSLHVEPLNKMTKAFAAGNPLDSKDVTEFIRGAWKSLRTHYDRSYASGTRSREELFPLHLPAMPQFRKIAAAKGKETLTDLQNGVRFEDSIGLVADWRESGKVWETPYGVLLPEKTRGLLTAGRCISAVNDAWEVFRVIPAAVMTGEAAGVAASLAVRRKCDPAELDVSGIQDLLRANGFRFHFDECPLFR